MNRSPHVLLRSLVVLSATMLFLWPHWNAVLRDPGACSFNVGYDGTKNYYTVAWHVKHDSSMLAFEGMNAPFGEHIDMPDAIPLLSNGLRIASGLLPDLREEGITAVNLFMIIGIPLTAILIMEVMIALLVPWWYAAVASIGIALTSPQHFRLLGHYALAASWVIPLMVLLVLRWERCGRRWGPLILLSGMLLLVHAVHLYLAAMAAGMVVLYGLWMMRHTGGFRPSLRLLASVALPVSLYGLHLKFTDMHSNRPEHPSGFEAYTAELDGLLRPYEWVASPLDPLFFGDPVRITQEAQCYLGAATWVCGLVLIGLVLSRRLFRGVQRTGTPLVDRPVIGLLFASSLLLLFAFGIPFVWLPDEVLWHTPLIPQFRAPARFAWPFFHVCGVIIPALLWLHRRTAPSSARKWVSSGALFVFPALALFEAYYFQRFFGRASAENPNEFSDVGAPPGMNELVKSLPADRPRALIPLPYFQQGGEYLSIPYENPSLRAACVFAYRTGVPMLAASMSRTSVDEVRQQIGLLTPPWYDRPLGKRFSSTDEFWLLTCGLPLTEAETRLLAAATPVGKAGDLTLWKIGHSDLFKDERQRMLAHVRGMLDTLTAKDGVFVSDTHTVVIHRGFDERSARKAIGGGAYEGVKSDHNVILDLAAGTLSPGKRYVISFWYYNRGPQKCHAFIGVRFRDPMTGKDSYAATASAAAATTLLDDWSLVRSDFEAPASDLEVSLVINGSTPPADTVWVDELLLREPSVAVVAPLGKGIDNGVLWNGELVFP
jgi:hypothetical protein